MVRRSPASYGYMWRCAPSTTRCAITRARATSAIAYCDERILKQSELPMTDSSHIPPLPPAIAGLAWRPLQPIDQDAITARSAACQSADGGQALIAADRYLHEGSAGT